MSGGNQRQQSFGMQAPRQQPFGMPQRQMDGFAGKPAMGMFQARAPQPPPMPGFQKQDDFAQMPMQPPAGISPTGMPNFGQQQFDQKPMMPPQGPQVQPPVAGIPATGMPPGMDDPMQGMKRFPNGRRY